MDELLKLLDIFEEDSKQMQNNHNESRKAFIQKNDIIRLKILTEVCRLYRDGTLQKVNEILNGKWGIHINDL